MAALWKPPLHVMLDLRRRGIRCVHTLGRYDYSSAKEELPEQLISVF